jgi:hypothetical protein
LFGNSWSLQTYSFVISCSASNTAYESVNIGLGFSSNNLGCSAGNVRYDYPFILPDGASQVVRLAYCSLSCSGGIYSKVGCDGTSTSGGATCYDRSTPNVTGSVSGYGVVTYTLPDGSPLPPCISPIPYSSSYCKGGNGLWASHANYYVDMFGYPGCSTSNGIKMCDYPSGAVSYESTTIVLPGDSIGLRPDGSQCTYSHSEVSHPYGGIVACPLGLTDDFSSSSNALGSSSSSASPNSSSSGEPVSSSSDSGNSSGSGASSGSSDPCVEFPYLPGCNSGGSSGSSNICDEFPDLPGCNVSGGSSGSDGSDGGSAGSGGSSDSEGGSAGSGNGNGNCTDINNCDWAKLDVQLVQLGVETQIRDNIKDVVGLLQHGYNVGQNQLGALNGIINAVNGNGSDVVGAINGIGDALGGKLDGIGAGFDSLGGKLDGIGKGLGDKLDSLFSSVKDFFGKGDGSCTGDDCAPGGLGVGDTSGFGSKAGSLISGGGRGFSPYTDEQIGALLPSKIVSGQCPVIEKQLSFFGTSIPFKIDFNNLVKGFDWAKFMKSCLLITVYFINCMSMIAIFRSGGRK